MIDDDDYDYDYDDNDDNGDDDEDGDDDDDDDAIHADPVSARTMNAVSISTLHWAEIQLHS